VRPDYVASFKIQVEDKPTFEAGYLVEDFRAFKGVRDVAIVDLTQYKEFALDVRFHGQTEVEFATSTADRIYRMLRRDSTLQAVEYGGLLGHEEPEAGLEWTGRDPFDEITSQHDGKAWVRADYFVHALSFEDLGLRDVNLEHMIIESLQRWPQRLPAREAVRRLREMYALLDEVRTFAGMPITEDEDEPVVLLGEPELHDEPVVAAATPDQDEPVVAAAAPAE